MQNPRKQGPETQGSTAELITGLVQLVPQSHMPEIAQEAMEVRGDEFWALEEKVVTMYILHVFFVCGFYE